MRDAFARFFKGPKAIVGAVLVACMVLVVGGAALATRSAGDHFADATFDKLGGDSDAILEAIANKVVDRISEKGGTLDSAQVQLVSQLAGAAGKKLDGIDADKLLAGVKDDVVAAGLGKLEGISTDQIVAQVTAALIAQAQAELAKIDINKLAKGALSEVAKNVDIDKLVKDQLANVDIEKLILKAVTGGSGSGGGSSVNLLSLLFKK